LKSVKKQWRLKKLEELARRQHER